MTPILYPSTETAFATNGLGILTDAVRCEVTEERNGLFELELDYPITGRHYAGIGQRSLILAKPNPADEPQPFRVYRATRPLGGVCTFYARHISYDLAGIPTGPFKATNAPAALAALKSSAAVPCPFTFWTDKDTAASMTVPAPASIRSLLGGVQGSVLDVYGGEYAWDRYTVRLYASRGADRGVTIRYGKNLTSLEQEENCAGVYTGVFPYWTDSEGGGLVQLPEKIVPAPGRYDFTRILTMDFSQDWQEPPTEAQLRARAERYIQENKVGTPKVSLKVSFVPLEQSEEYKHLALLERVSLCDTVTVQFARLGVDAAAKVIRTVYDVLRDRYESVELGDARSNLADTIAGQGQQIQEMPQKVAGIMAPAIQNATAAITGNLGGYVVLHSSTGGKEPDEFLIMDTNSIQTATKIWRFNKAGLAYSKNGYNGPYGLAMTADGQIVADFITTGTLNAAEVRVINLIADHLKSQSGGYLLDIWAAVFKMFDGEDLRVRIYTTDSVEQNPSLGLVQVFGGYHPASGAQDETSRYSYLSPYGLGVGEDKDGKYTGNVWCGAVIVGQGAALSEENGDRVGHFEKLAIGGNASQPVKFAWSATLGGYVLTTSDSLK